MPHYSSREPSCKDSISTSPLRKCLGWSSSSVQVAPALAKLAAAALVTASAGLGAVYAWGVGSEHGVILGTLFVLFAVGLEVAKPLSVVAAFKALASWQLVRGAALAILASVAIAYSLSAELSLVASTRGDVVAERQAVLNTSSTADADAKRARDRYEGASKELRGLVTSRPVAEVQAGIDALLLTPGADGCGTINGKVSARVCPQVASLKIEKARSDRRAELEGIVATSFLVSVSPTTHDGKSVKDADPGASALSTYLAALGFVLPATLLSDWLALVPVLALELGSALAGVLVQAVSRPTEIAAGKIRRYEEVYEPIEAEPSPTVGQVGHHKEIAASNEVGQEAERVKQAILVHLKERGEVEASQRGLAALIGTSRPTVRRSINGLMVAGLVAAEATRNGTMLRLLA